MADYRDPKVTTPKSKSSAGGGVGRWIAIAAAAIVVLLLLAWLLGWFGGSDVESVETVEPAATEEVVTGDEEVETIEVEGDAEVVE